MGERSRSHPRLAVTVFALVIASIAGYVVLPPRASGATVVCGPLTGTNVWTAAGSPYYMTCSVVVDSGATLAIQAGVTVLATPGAVDPVYLEVDGSIMITGTASAPVAFDSNASMPGRRDWGGIFLRETSYSQITGLVVQHAWFGLAVLAGTGGQGFVLRDSEFAFNDYSIYYASRATGLVGYFTGLSVHDNRWGMMVNSTASITSSTIRANDLTGIEASSPVFVSNSTVSDNGRSGINIRSWTPPPGTYTKSILTCNEIARNGFDPTATGYGIVVWTDAGVSAVTVSRNNLVDNAEQARDAGAGVWDDGRVGNFWSNYTGTDADGDGFGDTPYVIDADSQDNHPFMAPVAGCGPTPVDHPPAPATLVDAQLTGTGMEDVTLTWETSPDDGAGEDDVTEYLLYESTAFDPEGAGYTLLATLPAGTTTYAVPGAGVGDPDGHFYRLAAKDAAGQATASPDQFAKYARTLAAGAHLLSIPLRLSDTRIDSVLQSVDYLVARTYTNPSGQGKNWYSRVKDKPWGDLAAVDETIALWLQVRGDSDLVLAGLVRGSVTIHLDVGWNFVGYPSFVDRTVADALAGVRYQTVEGFDPTNAPFYLQRLDPASVMRAGDGFWIHLSEPFDWTLTN